LNGVVNGYNATVFAYGATGAGKTYTMLGTEDSPGLIVLTLIDLFKEIGNLSIEREYEIKFLFIEIYNENIKDLLSDSSKDECLDLREDPTKGVSISGVKEISVSSYKEIYGYVK
jgi:kinesin family protein 18/19